MDSHFKILLDNIGLTEGQQEDARTKYNGVCDTLHGHYYPDSEYDGSTKLLIGSYGKSTNIRPPRDVDTLFILPDEEFERIDGLEGNKQSQLLQEIRSVLKDTYTTTDKIKAFGKVVVVSFSEGTHTIELLPAWRLPDGRFRIPNTENGGSWEIYNAIADIEHISSSNKRTGNTLDLIRICKKWVEYCNVPVKSFVIELLTVEFLNTLDESSRKRGFANLVADFLKHFLGKVNGVIISATGEVISLADEWESRTTSAHQRAIKAIEYSEVGKVEEAADEWKKLFGDDFPKYVESAEANEITTAKVATLTTAFPSFKEEFLDRTKGINFRINPTYVVRIDARVTQDGFRPDLLSSFLARRYPLKKKKRLEFHITKNTIPQPYSVMWKVRNFGDEAKNANDLRGQITDDMGSERKVEHTKYFGEHYVECYIIKDGVCVGMARILVPVSREY